MNTGQCCKPGGNCTICPRSYRLTPQGCEYCGDCVDRLLEIVTGLDYNITTVLNPLQSGVSGVLVQTSLDEVNKTLQRYCTCHLVSLIVLYFLDVDPHVSSWS